MQFSQSYHKVNSLIVDRQGAGIRWSLRSLPAQTILWFYTYTLQGKGQGKQRVYKHTVGIHG